MTPIHRVQSAWHVTSDTNRGKKLEEQIAAHTVICYAEINKATKQPARPPFEEARPINRVRQQHLIRGAAARDKTRLALGAQALRGGKGVQPRAQNDKEQLGKFAGPF